MTRTYTLVDYSSQGDAVIVSPRKTRLDENEILTFTDELRNVANQPGCRKLILRLGPHPVECLYSVFLARLVTLQRALVIQNIALILAEMHPDSLEIFRACMLDKYFLFADSLQAALDLVPGNPLPGELARPCQNPRCATSAPDETTC